MISAIGSFVKLLRKRHEEKSGEAQDANAQLRKLLSRTGEPKRAHLEQLERLLETLGLSIEQVELMGVALDEHAKAMEVADILETHHAEAESLNEQAAQVRAEIEALQKRLGALLRAREAESAAFLQAQNATQEARIIRQLFPALFGEDPPTLRPQISGRLRSEAWRLGLLDDLEASPKKATAA